MRHQIAPILQNLRRSLPDGGGSGILHGSSSSVFKIAAMRGLTAPAKLPCEATLKLLRMEYCCKRENIRGFEKDARALSRLDHANIQRIYHFGRALTGQPFVIVEKCEGTPLSAVLERGSPLQWQRVVDIFCQVCDALQYVHEQGVVHGELKPQNIIVSSAGGSEHVKIVGFSLGAASAVRRQSLAPVGARGVAIQPHASFNALYLSPEQCSGSLPDPRSDVYSLGTIMYECLTGKPPFAGTSEADVMIRQLAGDPAPFHQAAPDVNVPGWLEVLVMRALQKDKTRRFRSMGEMKAALLNGTKKAGPVRLPVMPRSQAEEDIADPFVGKVIGDCYRIESFIGGGGMSRVYKAVQKGTDRLVAVKFLKSELCESEAAIKRFEREAKSLGRVSHPNLIAIFDVGQADTGQPYMVTEFLDGKSLRELLNEHGRLSVSQAVSIFMQVCDVMEFTHRQGIIHRDLKPANIMLVNQGGRSDVVKVVDFGIVKLDEGILSVSQKLTASGEICGSPMYMSPEQIQDEPLDARTDIYSLGTVMFEVISGRPLFGGKLVTEVMNQHIKTPPPVLSVVAPDAGVSGLLDRTVRACLEKRPEHRFQTMAELKEALTAVQAEMKGDTTGAPLIIPERLKSQSLTPVFGQISSAKPFVIPEKISQLPFNVAVDETSSIKVKLVSVVVLVLSTALVSVGLTLLILNITAHH